MNGIFLAVDIGNTCIDLGLFRGTRLLAHDKLSTASHPVSGPWVPVVEKLLKSIGCSDRITSVGVASVVRDSARILLETLAPLCPGPAGFICSSADAGLEIRYDRPESVGIDRLLAAAAASQRTGAAHPVVVADAGTALTVDAVCAGGVFRGGVIVPGLRLGMQALQQGTSLLPQVEPDPRARLIGRSTRECMQSGALHGTAAMLTTLFRRFEVNLGRPVQAYLTGGDASLLAPLIQRIVRVDPALVLHGIRLARERRSVGSP